MKKSLLVIFALFLLGNSTIDNKSNYNIPSRARSIFTDDTDLDNDQDIIIGHLTGVGYTNPSVTLLLNDGQGYFETYDTSNSYYGYQYDIFSADLNNDYYPEIITFLTIDNNTDIGRYIRVIINSEGVFNEYQDISLNQSESFDYKTYGDTDGDGFPDIIVSSYGCQCWGILYNDGQGNFAEPEYYYNIPHNDMDAGLINDDSLTDVVLCGATTEIFYSTGTGFTNQTIDNGSLRVKIDDMNGDQKNDIIGFDNLYAITWITFYENTGDANFIQHEVIELSSGCYRFVTTDLNNDALPDILCLLNSQSRLYILYNTGEFTLADPVFIPIDYYGESTRQIHCDDLDGNGYNDIIITRGYGAPLPANLTILFNDGNGNFVENPITGIETQNPKPKTQNLLCYPNPVHSNATIEFILEKPSEINLVLIDISGKEVKWLVSGRFFQAGKHTVNLETGELKKGIYFVKMNFGINLSQFIKIIIN